MEGGKARVSEGCVGAVNGRSLDGNEDCFFLGGRMAGCCRRRRLGRGEAGKRTWL